MARTAVNELADSVHAWRRVYGDARACLWADDADDGRLALVTGSYNTLPQESGAGPVYVDTGRLPRIQASEIDVPVDVKSAKTSVRCDIATALAAGFRRFEIKIDGQVMVVEVRDAK